MCTVSFVNSHNKRIITSNRDEIISRPIAFAPEIITLNGKQIIFPKDPQAGGSWFTADSAGNYAILLNGAAERHEHNPPYKRSRGLVLIDVIAHKAPLDAFATMDLEGMEPFTIVLYLGDTLQQLRWNGIDKNIKLLDAGSNYIWSSATLYTKEVIANREEWFSQFIADNPEPTEAALQAFHNYTHANDNTNGLVINRNGLFKTFSITQAYVEKNVLVMHHNDLLNTKEYTTTLAVKK
jgi:uncharacterized protein with NRDE domain